MKNYFLIIVSFIFLFSCSQQRKNQTILNTEIGNYKIHNDFKKYFDSCAVEGAIVIFDKNNQQWILSDTLSVNAESLPASTFKIINLLIALETQTIKDENDMVKWVGKTDTTKYGYRPEIYHDMTVKEAFEVSAGWVFIELAKKIGKGNYRNYLAACNYGNLNLTQSNDDFWNFGKFGISPINQVEFIKNLYEGKLPFSKRNIDIVKKVMIAEQTDNYTIRAKTGWTRENNINTGWWIGYLEAGNNTYFFAIRLLQDRKKNRDDFGSCRKEITKKIFYDLGFLKSNDESFKKSHSLFNSIDHIPIVVNDLEKIKDIFQNQLLFTIKEGKVHEGIKNCFVKFQDGTYLEFIEPLDNSKTTGQYYAEFLKTRQGGTTLAISISNTELIKFALNKTNIPFTAESNSVWQTIEPENYDLFFIDYVNKNWKENAANTTHSNTAKSLTAAYVLTNDIETETKKYKALGFTVIESGNYLETTYKLFKIGQSSLYLLDGQNFRKINKLFSSKKLQGICGFEIKVNSLQTVNKQIKQYKNVVFEKNSTIIYFTDYSLFLKFKE